MGTFRPKKGREITIRPHFPSSSRKEGGVPKLTRKGGVCRDALTRFSLPKKVLIMIKGGSAGLKGGKVTGPNSPLYLAGKKGGEVGEYLSSSLSPGGEGRKGRDGVGRISMRPGGGEVALPMPKKG